MKFIRRTITFLLLASMLISMLAMGIGAAPATRSVVQPVKTADPTTYDLTKDATKVSTKYNGSLWADKSVSANMGIYSDLIDYTLADDELEVALSAISQTFPITTTTETYLKKANIVFAIDVSTSMTSNTLMVNGISRSRMWVLQQVAQDFIDTLLTLNDDEDGNETGEFDINISIVLYAGQGTTYQLWTPLNETTAVDVKDKLSKVKVPTASDCIGATDNGNTNSQAGAYIARMMYSDQYAEAFGRPANYADKTTNNFIIFMTDGAPNRYYENGTTGTPGDPDSSGVANITLGYDSTHNIYYTNAKNEGLTRTISNTDYKKMSAYTLLQQVEEMRKINNSVVFSLGLGEWFTDDDELSGFPTATYLCQLVAAVGNGTYDPSNGEVITADYCWNNYLGYDVPDGSMLNPNPRFPDIELDAAKYLKNGYYTYSLTSSNTHYFNTMQDLIDAMNLPNATDTFIDARSGQAVTKEAAFYARVIRTEDSRFTTIDACGIPDVPDDVLSQVVYYYAGNTAEKFSNSMQDIVTAIATSFGNHVTAITNFGDPLVDGVVKFVDTIGAGMEVRKCLGVVFNDVYYNGASQAQFFLNYDAHVWTNEDAEAFNNWCKLLQYVYGVPVTKSTIEMLIQSSIAGGDIYYNSATDYNCQFAIYGRYIEGLDAYQYVGPYYNLDGTVATPPAEATHIVHQYIIPGNVDCSVLVDEDVSLMYLQMAHAINLTTGTESMILNVPAALIPIRTVISTDGRAVCVTDPMPISMVYTVGLRDDLSADMLQINTSTDAQGNTLHTFYTNAWKSPAALAQSDLGTTYATFTANPVNPYYHATENILLYVQDAAAADGYRPAVASDTGTFYLQNNYADSLGTTTTYQPASECFDVTTATLFEDANGTVNYYIPDGTLRHDDTLEASRAKETNTTQTNPYFYNSVFHTDEDGYTAVRVNLGNNGKLVIGETQIEDYVVVDYGLPVDVDMNGFDMLTANSAPKVTAIGTNATSVNGTNAVLNCGTLSLTDGVMRYEPSTTDFSTVDTGYFLCQAEINGTLAICRGTLRIVPATNMTYEERFLTFTDAEGAAWSTVGTPTNAVQSSENSHYGYDAAYAENAANLDSLGSARVVTVSDPYVQPYASFSFTGTGFDILSRTGADCGLMLVEVRADSPTGQLKRVLFVDNYLNADTLYQLPVVHEMLDYDMYCVKVIAYYNIAFDHATRRGALSLEKLRGMLGYDDDVELKYYSASKQADTRAAAASTAGQYKVYLDGIRIYNPLGTELSSYDGVAYTAYSEAGELNPSYLQVRGRLLDASDWTGDSDGAVASEGDPNYNASTDGAVYLAGTDSTVNGPGYMVNHQGIYLSSSGQMRKNENGELLDADGAVLKLTVAIDRYSLYYYDGELIKTEQPDGTITYTDKDGNEVTKSRLYYINNETRVFLTKQQELSLNICYYDDAYDTESAQNEVYLKNGQAIAFTVDASNYVQISIKSPNGLPVQLCVYDRANEQWVQLDAVSGGMEQYVNISDYIVDGDCILKCVAASPNAILSIVNVKITNDAGAPARMSSTPKLVYASRLALDNDAVADAPHVHTYAQQTVTEPTCTENGVAKMVCECGDSYEIELPATGHIETFATLHEPTCTQEGEIIITCSACGAHRTQTIAAIGHDLNMVVLNEAQSDKDALLQFTCNRCGLQFTLYGEAAYGPMCEAYHDIPDNWAREGITFVISKGLLTGTSADTFSPNEELSRAMLVTALYRLANKPNTSGEYPFTDVAEGKYYFNAVSWAYEHGIARGVSATQFAPKASMTREQLAAMLYRYCACMGYDISSDTSLHTFADADSVSGWAVNEMKWAVERGILRGMPDNTLRPLQTTTRAEVATMLMRLKKTIIDR